MPAASEVDRRAQQLYDRLTEVSARALSEVTGPGGSRLEFWQVGQTVVVIQFYRHGGWEIYAPISPSLAVQDSFAALDVIRVK